MQLGEPLLELETKTSVNEKQERKIMLTKEQKEYLNILSKESTAYEISDKLNIPIAQIYSYFHNNKIPYKKKNKKWTCSEVEFLKEKYGNLHIKEIARLLNRSVTAIIAKTKRLKLGSFTSNADDYITLNSLLQKIGVDRSYTKKIEKFNFPIRTILVRNKRVKIVYIDQLLQWLEKENNKHLVDFSNLEDGEIFAVEPEWFKEKRKADKMYQRFKKTKWTDSESQRLISLCEEYKFSYKEISYKLNRTEGAIKKQLLKLKVKVRPLRAENHDKWTAEEISFVKKMYQLGYKSDIIKDFLPKRGALGIKGLLERHNFFIKSHKKRHGNPEKAKAKE